MSTKKEDVSDIVARHRALNRQRPQHDKLTTNPKKIRRRRRTRLTFHASHPACLSSETE